MKRARTVILATEGTYPYHVGGVSTWCDTLVRQMPDTRFIVVAVIMNPYVSARFPLPATVERVIAIPLWGTQDPSEHRTDLPFSEVFLKKQRTSEAQVRQIFLPLFQELLGAISTRGRDAAALGQVFLGMYRYFQMYDYQETFKAEDVWQTFKTTVMAEVQAGLWPEPTIFDLVQALGWVYRFLIILNTPIPQADVTHSSAAAFCGLIGIVGKLLHGTPYLLTEHGVYLREQYLSVGRSTMSPFAKAFLLAFIQSIVRANLHHADELAPVCRFNARWEQKLGVPPERIHVIYNGVNPGVFQPRPKPAPPGDDVRVVSIARIDPNKDIETLLRAAAIVHARAPRARFIVQGAVSVPEYHRKMLALREELQLEEVVDFAGHTDDIARTYQEADIIVQSSVSEAFPYSVIEAMMSGKPIVATDVGGTAEALAGTGLLVPARDPARMAVAILQLIDDPALRAELGEGARARALDLFTVERTTRSFAERYAALAGERDAAAATRRRQVLALTRAYALAGVGMYDAALGQLQDALRLDPAGPLAGALLAQMAEFEERLGRRANRDQRLIQAWLIDRLQRAG
ncbi:MAG: GT4 family glycosyltransferase PelF [Firmicutes bacterium]|nr:GT4 family glycosyltransferase PelF [Bacillota bacterium]